MDAEVEAVVRLAAHVAGTTKATVNVLDERSQCQIATVGFTGSRSPAVDSMCAVTVRAGTSVHAPDARQDDRFADNPWVTGALGAVRCYAASPIRVGAEQAGHRHAVRLRRGPASADRRPPGAARRPGRHPRRALRAPRAVAPPGAPGRGGRAGARPAGGDPRAGCSPAPSSTGCCSTPWTSASSPATPTAG
nr:hypothetical protein [Angustibacter aerolatus]